MTFAFGLANFHFIDGFLISKQHEVTVDLPSASEEVLVVSFATEENGFFPYAHGCGGVFKDGGQGSSTVYETEKFRKVSVDNISYPNEKKAVKAFKLRLKDVGEVLVYSEKRIVIRYELEKMERVEITKFIGDASINIITAPDLELALKFEKWLDKN